MTRVLVISLGLCLVLGTAVYAQDAAQTAPAAAADKNDAKPSQAESIVFLAACLGAALAAVGAGLGIGKIGASCMDAIARQPEAGSTLFAPMVVAAAMVEGLGLFAIVVCLIALVTK